MQSSHNENIMGKVCKTYVDAKQMGNVNNAIPLQKFMHMNKGVINSDILTISNNQMIFKSHIHLRTVRLFVVKYWRKHVKC